MSQCDRQVAAGDDDAHEKDSGGNFSRTTPTINLYSHDADPSSRWNGGFRFTNITITPGATISAAHIHLYIPSKITDDMNVDIFAEDVDDAVDFLSNEDVTSRVPTSASAPWVEDSLGNAVWAESPEIKTVIQEIIDRGGWASGQDIVILVKGKSDTAKSCAVSAYETSSSLAAKLHITFAAAEPQTITLTTGIASAEAFGSPVVVGPLIAMGIPSTEAFGAPVLWHRYRCVDWEDDGESFINHMWAEDLPEGFCEDDHQYMDWWNNFDWHECGLAARDYPGGPYGDPHTFYLTVNDYHLFPIVTIPTGSIIAAAKMRMRRYFSSVGPELSIRGEDADDAQQVASSADYESRDRTAAYALWTPSGIGVGEWWETPNLASILNQIVRRPGWASGQAIHLFFEPNVEIPLEDAGGMWSWWAARNVSPPPDLREDRPQLYIRLSPGILPVGLESAEAFGTLTISTLITPPSIGSAEAFGSLQVNLTVHADAIVSMETFGSSIVTGPVSGVGAIASAEAFGTAQVNLTVSASSVASVEAFGTTSVQPGEVIASPSAIASVEGFGTPQLNLATAGVGAIASAEAFGSPVVAGPLTATGIASVEAFGTTQVNLHIAPSAIGTAETFGAAQVNLTIAPSSIVSSEAFGAAQVNQHVAPSSIASAEAFGGAALNLKLEPGAITSLEAFGSPSVAGPITAAGIATAEAFGTPQVNLGAAVGGIASAEAFGTAVLITGGISVSPGAIASAEALGSPVVNLAGETQTVVSIAIASTEAFGTALLTGPISVTGIATAEAFGSASVSTGAATLQPGGVSSAEAFGTATLIHVVSPSGIASAEAFGTAALSVGGPQTLTLTTGIASAEAFGSPIVAGPIAPVAIASEETFGTLTIGLVATPSGIASAEAFGTAAISVGSPQGVSPPSIASLEVFGLPIVAGPLTGAGIASSEAFGTAEITVAGITTLWPDGIVSVEAFGTASVGPSWVPVVTDDGSITLLLVQDGSVSLPGAVNDGTISIRETEDATI